MGAIFNAQANHTPLLVTAGQQARALMTLQANLTNRDATRMPHPLVKWSYEPPRAADVPLALGRAIHLADTPAKGPAFVSIPMDDWEAEVDEGDARAVVERTVAAALRPRPGRDERPRRGARGGGEPAVRRRARTSTPRAPGRPRSPWSSASSCR